MVEVIGHILHLLVLTTVGDARMLADQGQVMRRHDHSRSFRRYLEEQLDDLLRGLRVETARRLISQDQFRMIEDGPRDGDTLLLTTRELEGHAAGFVVHSHSFQHLMDALVDLVMLLPASRLEHELQILIDGTVCEQLEILEDDTHLPSQGRNLLPSDGQQVTS